MRSLGFSDTLLIPEDRNGVYSHAYEGQFEWETQGLQTAVCIMFWMPRRMSNMPGLTSNDEWGYWKASGKVVFGAPPWAEKVRYQQLYCQLHGIPSSLDLIDTCQQAITMFNSLYEPDITVEWP